MKNLNQAGMIAPSNYLQMAYFYPQTNYLEERDHDKEDWEGKEA